MIIQSLVLAAVIAAAEVTSGGIAQSTVSETAETEEQVYADPAVIARYEGDWVGALRVDSISVPFLDWVGKTWDVVARFSFDDDGRLNLFLRTPFPDWEFDFRDISAELDPWLEDVFVGGKFLGFPMKEPAILSFTYSFDGSIVLHTVLEADEAGSADLAMTLRRIGDEWTGEEEPGIDPAEALSYKGKTLGEVMDILKMDDRDLPEETHVGESEASGDYTYEENDPYRPEE